MAQVSEWRREAQRRESPWKSPINVEAPALNGGDPWAGARGSDEDLKDTVDEAMSSTIFEPIIPQFYPSRAWLWQRWRGTILQRVLPNEVFWNSVFAAQFVWGFGRIAATAALRNASSVNRDRGRRSARTAFMTTSPQRRAALTLSGSSAGTSLTPIGESPSIVRMSAIVLAVN